MPQAINSYRDVSLVDREGVLNLAWTLDERRLLAMNLDSLISRELEEETQNGLEYVNLYAVKDPYGEQGLGPSVARFFSYASEPWCVTCGAGVISLLHALARLANGAPVQIVGETYPDFPFWVGRHGSRCVPCDAASAPGEIAQSVNSSGASLVFLERPSLTGDRFSELAELSALCEGAAMSDALVIVDESNANYYPPAFSAVHLIPTTGNLIVLRGLSKAYGLGGLRLSYCLAPARLGERVRSVVPPLLASSLSTRIGKKILELGDIAAPLRDRIQHSKTELSELLERAGLRKILQSSEFLPYLLLADSPAAIRSTLEDRGVLGKLHTVWPGSGSDVRYLYRLSAPLSAERMHLLRLKIGTQQG